MTKKMVFVDTSLCTGCRACSVACKAWNELPAEKNKLITSYQSQKGTTPKTWTYVSFHEKYENGKSKQKKNMRTMLLRKSNTCVGS
jgi:formate dehydrogenase iron-sulfur subunit